MRNKIRVYLVMMLLLTVFFLPSNLLIRNVSASMSAPTNVTIEYLSDDCFNISWTPDGDADYTLFVYQRERPWDDTDEMVTDWNDGFVEYINTSTNYINLSGGDVTPNSNYSYRIYSVNGTMEKYLVDLEVDMDHSWV